MSQAIPLNSLAKKEKIVHDRPPMLAIGVMIWLGSELMFFSGLFAALFTIRAHLAAWPPTGTKLDTLQSGIFTIILVASSFTMQWAVWLVEHRERGKARNWVIITIVMGALFMGNQIYEWGHLTTRWYTNSFGSVFFITTGRWTSPRFPRSRQRRLTLGVPNQPQKCWYAELLTGRS